jgi:large subunit ribosomal protein L7A
MINELADGKPMAVGIRQTIKAIEDGRALKVFLAQDADSDLTAQILQAAKDKKIPAVFVATMQELGRACKIQVPASAAAIIKG